MAQKQVFILNTRLDSTNAVELLTNIGNKLSFSANKLASKAKTDKFYIVTPNPEIVLAASKDKALQEVINKADFSVPDGVGLKLFGNTSLTIIHGRKLMLDLFKLANERKLKVYFLTSNILDSKAKLLTKIREEYPNINAQAMVGPHLNSQGEPVTQVDTSIQSDIVMKINNFRPDLVFVCFGASKQEKWIARWLPKLNTKGAIGVGGSLDYYAGVKPLPPYIFEKLELEWLWRMFTEKGHIRRVVNAVVVFPMYVIRHKLFGI